MAFREPWQDEAEVEPPRKVFPWVGVAFGGLLLGLVAFALVLPGGPLHPLVEQAAKPLPTATLAPTADVTEPPGTTCGAPTADPPTAVRDFVADLNAGDLQSAWTRLDASMRYSAYADDFDAFRRQWGGLQALNIGQMTYRTTEDGGALLLADLTFRTDTGRTSSRLRFQLTPSADNCQWLITAILFPDEANPTAPAN